MPHVDAVRGWLGCGNAQQELAAFHIKVEISLRENARELRSREWTKAAKRQFV